MIRFACTCGKTMTAPDTAAGKRGKCPKCGAAVEVPGAVKAAPELELADVAPRAAGGHFSSAPQPAGASTAPTTACPKCRSAWPAETLFCVHCGTEIATGRTISPGRSAGARFRSQGQDDDTPFWKATLGLFTGYADTIEALPGRLKNTGFRWKVLGFYAASFVVVSLALARMATSERESRPSYAPPASTMEELSWSRAMGSGTEHYDLKVVEPSATVVPGERARFQVEVRDASRKTPVDVDVWMKFVSGDPAAPWTRMDRSPTTGTSVAEPAVPSRTGRVTVDFKIQPRGKPAPERDAALVAHSFYAGKSVTEGSSGSGPSVFGIVIFMILFVVTLTTISTAFHAGLIKLAALILGDEGSFVTMFLATIYMTGFMLFTVAALTLLPTTGFIIGLFFVMAFSVIFSVRVVMAVFGQSGWKAFATVIVAGVLNSAVGSALSFMLGMLGLFALAMGGRPHP